MMQLELLLVQWSKCAFANAADTCLGHSLMNRINCLRRTSVRGSTARMLSSHKYSSDIAAGAAYLGAIAKPVYTDQCACFLSAAIKQSSVISKIAAHTPGIDAESSVTMSCSWPDTTSLDLAAYTLHICELSILLLGL